MSSSIRTHDWGDLGHTYWGPDNDRPHLYVNRQWHQFVNIGGNWPSRKQSNDSKLDSHEPIISQCMLDRIAHVQAIERSTSTDAVFPVPCSGDAKGLYHPNWGENSTQVLVLYSGPTLISRQKIIWGPSQTGWAPHPLPARTRTVAFVSLFQPDCPQCETHEEAMSEWMSFPCLSANVARWRWLCPFFQSIW